MTSHDIKELQKISGYPCVSIFIPTHRTMPDRLKDPVKIKDLVGQAVDRLLKEFPKKDVESFAETLDKIIEKIDYTKLLDGLAIFINKDFAQIYTLPFPIREKVVIDDSFSLRDIIYVFNRSPHYWALILHAKQARLFEGARNSLIEVTDPAALREKQEGFPFDWPWEVTNDKKYEAFIMGEIGDRYLLDQQIHMFKKIDNLLDKHIGKTDWPCVLLTTHDNFANFMKDTKHAERIVAQGKINPHAANGEIAKTAWKLMEEYIKQERKNSLKLFEEAVSRGHHAFDLTQVWRMAYEGRIHTLLVEENYSVPGKINPVDSSKITVYEKADTPKISDDLIDHLVESVLSKRGRVIFVDPGALKEYQKIAAILRY
jgi:hypothetical protein